MGRRKIESIRYRKLSWPILESACRTFIPRVVCSLANSWCVLGELPAVSGVPTAQQAIEREKGAFDHILGCWEMLGSAVHLDLQSLVVGYRTPPPQVKRKCQAWVPNAKSAVGPKSSFKPVSKTWINHVPRASSCQTTQVFFLILYNPFTSALNY